MTDLDFDELDKAVNSLMGDVPAPQAKTSAPESSNVPEVYTAEESAPAVSAVETPVSSTPASVSPAVRPTPSLAVKRRGQFMDVMHPSADMKTPSRAPRSTAIVSRQGVTLAPAVEAPSEVPAADQSTPEKTPETLDSQSDTTLDTPVSSPSWPDPIDIAQQQDSVSASEATPVAEALATEDSAQSDTVEPLSSPFIPGAKVEKRPLGQAQPSGSTAEDVEAPAQIDIDTTEATLPTELSGDVLAVESNELKTEEAVPAAEVAPAPEVETPKETPEPVSVPSEPPVSETPEGPASIPPQYKTDENGDEPAEHSALYDAVNTHVASPAKKKSGWLVPVAIIGLIILGCAGGVFIYYYLL